MGNERSALSGLEIGEKAIEITDFWLQHSASLHGSNPQNLSVFVSEPSLHSTASFGKPSPLERAAKVRYFLFVDDSSSIECHNLEDLTQRFVFCRI